MGFLDKLFGRNTQADDSQKKKDFDILKYDGIRALHIGKTVYAAKCLEEAVALQPDAEAYARLSEAYRRLDREEDGRQAIQQALALAPQSPTLLFLAAQDDLATHHELDAVVKLTQAIAQKDDFTEAYQLRAQVLWGMKQAKEAMEDVEHLLALDANDDQALTLKGRILSATGQTDEALELFRRVLTVNPFSDEAYLGMGAIHLANKEYDAAIAVYDEAIEINPQFAQAYHERGRAKLLKGDKEGSVEDIKQAMTLAPEKAAAVNGEFNNYEQLQRFVPFG
jgi:tetratricopeptide (TPR) repeat protein